MSAAGLAKVLYDVNGNPIVAALERSDPEIGEPLKLAPHAPALVMVVPLVIALVLIVVGAVMRSKTSDKTTGSTLVIAGLLLGSGAAAYAIRWEYRLNK